MESILTTAGLTKTYGRTKAVNGVDLHVPQGAVYGLAGGSGAGKTTLLKLLAGLARPTAGEIRLFGLSGREMSRYMGRIGAMVDGPGLYPNMTAAQNLHTKCLAMGLRPGDERERLLAAVGLQDEAGRKVKDLSHSARRRLGIAMAMAGSPDVLLLDDPFAGVGAADMPALRRTLLELNRERNVTVLFSCHELGEMSDMCTHYGVLRAGVLLQELTAAKLADRCRARLVLRTGEAERACTVLEEMGVRQYRVTDGGTVEAYEHLEDSGGMIKALVLAGVPLAEAALRRESPEDYFLRLTGG